LTVIGGIIVFVVGILGLLGVALPVTLTPITFGGIPTSWIFIMLGIIAMILSHRASHIISAIILIIIGFVVGSFSNIAGILLIVGGIIGLISRFI
jgi:hypothetical protein